MLNQQKVTTVLGSRAINDSAFIVICAASFTLAQCATSESCSVALTVAPTGNCAATVEQQRASVADV